MYITHPACTEGTGVYAGRLQTFAETVVAEGALVGNLEHGVEKAGGVRAGHDAIAATDTPCPIDQNDSIVRFIGGADWTDLRAGGG